MSEAEFWRDYKAFKKECSARYKQECMNQALERDDGGWTKHTEYHWSREVKGKRLDFWPSTRKYQYEGKVMVGNVVKFIKKIEGGAT